MTEVQQSSPNEDSTVEMRVAGSTGTKELARAITSHIRDGKDVVLVAIGAQAISQANKAVPVVNSYLASKAMMYTILPYFQDREIEDEDTGAKMPRTVLMLRLVRYNFR